MTPAAPNPYEATKSQCKAGIFPSVPRYPGRALIMFLLAVMTAFTAVLTGGLWKLGAIELGRFGYVFLGSLVLATLLLGLGAKFYFSGSRRTAILLIIAVPCLIGMAIVVALEDAGIINLF